MNELKEINEEKLAENYKFRTFLKIHADEKQLDQDFKRLHEKYIKKIDCSKCRNCCKKLGISKFSLIKFSIKALRYLMKETYGRIKALQITILLEN